MQLSLRSKEIKRRAREHARRCGHGHLGTEHYFAAIFAAAPKVTTSILEKLGVYGLGLYKAFDKVSPPPNERSEEPILGLKETANAEKMMECADQEAVAQGDKQILPEHILFGLLRLKKCKAVAMLKEMKVSPEEVRTKVFESLRMKKAKLICTKAAPDIVCFSWEGGVGNPLKLHHALEELEKEHEIVTATLTIKKKKKS